MGVFSSLAHITPRNNALNPFFLFFRSYFGLELCHLYPLHQYPIDRYLVVTYPIKHRILMNAKVMIL